MLTYQVRPRRFRLTGATALTFPADGEIRFTFTPLQPFGGEAGGGRTTVRDVGAVVHFDANNGRHTIESKTPLKPLEVAIDAPERRVHLTGNILVVSQRFASNRELTDIIESVYFGLPALLNYRAFG